MFRIGIDLGGTKISAGVVDNKGSIIAKAGCLTQAQRPTDKIVEDMASAALNACKTARIDISEISGVGIGCPGTIDSRRGIVVTSNNIPMKNYPMAEVFKRFINKPVAIDNDANCAALGEQSAGAAAGHKDVIMITLGTGIGGGIIINGKIYSGFNSAGAELGHILLEIDGKPCTCGRRGCWEAYASASALLRQAASAMQKNKDSLLYKQSGGETKKIDGLMVFNAAAAGDSTAKEVLERYFIYVAEGVTSLINIFQPEVFLIGGGLANQGENLTAPIRSLVQERLFCREGIPMTQIRTAALANDAGIVGAAMLAD